MGNLNINRAINSMKQIISLVPYTSYIKALLYIIDSPT